MAGGDEKRDLNEPPPPPHANASPDGKELYVAPKKSVWDKVKQFGINRMDKFIDNAEALEKKAFEFDAYMVKRGMEREAERASKSPPIVSPPPKTDVKKFDALVPRNRSGHGFELHGSCDIKKDGVTVESVAQLLKLQLSNYYKYGDITVTPTGVRVNGNLKDIFETAVTDAVVDLKRHDDKLVYRVTGSASLGTTAWVFFIIGLFTGVFLGVFLLLLVEYLICRDRPKQYFQAALDAVKFEIG